MDTHTHTIFTWYDDVRKAYTTSVIFLPQMHTQVNHKETSDKFKLRDVLQNDWPIILKNVKTLKVKEKLRKHFHLKKAAHTKLGAIHDSWLVPFAEDDSITEANETKYVLWIRNI